MARQLRIEFPGAWYHVMARGNRREPIFICEQDRELFLATLGEACSKTGWRMHAWVLMTNHYHWILETPEANLVKGMGWFQNTYTRRFNHRHRMWGHLFGGRYKAVVVESEGSSGHDYLGELFNYVHLNPARAGMVEMGKGKGLLDFGWSSLSRGYAVAPSQRPRWLETATGFEVSGVSDTVAGRRTMIRRLERRMCEEAPSRCGWSEREGQTLNSTLKRGWYWGSENFREKLLGQLERQIAKAQNRNYRSSEQNKAHDEAEAKRLLGLGMEALGLRDSDIRNPMRGDLRRVAIAKVLDSRTTVSQTWIAQKLNMKSAANVSQQVRRFSKIPQKHLPAPIREWIESVDCC
jgi:putative transposase